jgi:hypothetical protein
MTRAALRYSVIGLITFVIGLVAFLPARVAAGWAEQAVPVSIGGVTGTVFKGRASYVSGPGGAVENLAWNLHPAALLIGHISADLEIDSDLGGFSAQVSRSLFGQNTLENISGSASAGWLAKLGGYTFLPLSADVRVDISEAVFDDDLKFDALDGEVRVENTRWELFNPPVRLGRFTTALSKADEGIRATIMQSEGPLALDGALSTDESRRYQMDVRLRARWRRPASGPDARPTGLGGRQRLASGERKRPALTRGASADRFGRHRARVVANATRRTVTTRPTRTRCPESGALRRSNRGTDNRA